MTKKCLLRVNKHTVENICYEVKYVIWLLFVIAEQQNGE